MNYLNNLHTIVLKNQFNQKLKRLGEISKYNLYYFLTHSLSESHLDL
jgi:hypothetical protein